MDSKDIELHNLIMHMFEKIEKEASGLSDWEDSFINSIKKQYEEKGYLSVKQRDILERIYSEKTD